MSGRTWGESWGITGHFAWGDSWGFEGVTPPPSSPPPAATTNLGVGGRAWANRTGLPKKKKKLVDELDEILIELRSRIEEAPPVKVEPTWVKELRKQEAFANSDLIVEATQADLQARLAMVRAIVREMDDEETLLLALH